MSQKSSVEFRVVYNRRLNLINEHIKIITFWLKEKERVKAQADWGDMDDVAWVEARLNELAEDRNKEVK